MFDLILTRIVAISIFDRIFVVEENGTGISCSMNSLEAKLPIFRFTTEF